jgi:hypothetical protein
LNCTMKNIFDIIKCMDVKQEKEETSVAGSSVFQVRTYSHSCDFSENTESMA